MENLIEAAKVTLRLGNVYLNGKKIGKVERKEACYVYNVIVDGVKHHLDNMRELKEGITNLEFRINRQRFERIAFPRMSGK